MGHLNFFWTLFVSLYQGGAFVFLVIHAALWASEAFDAVAWTNTYLILVVTFIVAILLNLAVLASLVMFLMTPWDNYYYDDYPYYPYYAYDDYYPYYYYDEEEEGQQ